MKNYEDTLYTEYIERGGLSEHEIGQDELDFYLAFGVIGGRYNESLGINVYTNEDYERYFTFNVSQWSVKDDMWTLEEVLTAHKCNETDKEILFARS